MIEKLISAAVAFSLAISSVVMPGASLLAGAATEGVNAVAATEAPTFETISLTLTGIIGANVFYTIPDAYLTENYIVETEFTGAGVSKVTVPLDVNKVVSTAGKKHYMFTLPVKSCNMQKEYFARLYVRKASDRSTVATTGRDTVVVSNYVNAFAASSDAIKSAFGKAMQTYGYYSQKMFNDLEELPNITLLNLSDVTTSTVADYESDIRPYRGTIKGEISQTSLYLDSGTGIRAYLSNLSADVDTSNLYMQYKVGTVTNRVKVQRDNAGKYYGEVPDVPADKLSAMYSIAFYEGKTQITDTTNYGAYSYIYTTLNSPSVSKDLKNLVRALYKYSVATEALLESLPPDDSSSTPDSSSVADSSSKVDDSSSVTDSSSVSDEKGAAYTGEYVNLFAEMGISSQKVEQKLNDAFNQLFYGTDGKDIINEGKRVYYPVGDDMAYIYDTGNNDVRSEGMSYGMMIAVQMNKKEEFDRLWKWAKTYMYHSSGERKGMFAWQCTTSGDIKDNNSAPDGEEYFAAALLFASARWGDGEGIYNYRSEALNILSYMLYVNDRPGYQLNTAIDPDRKMVVFVPYGSAATFTDPSYHVPAFYELFARESPDKTTWLEVAKTSREFFRKCTHEKTGLSPEYATFEGEGCGGRGDYGYDAWRVPMNIAMDYSWWRKDDEWQVAYANRIQSFFHSEGIGQYLDNYTLDGVAKYNADHSIGAVGCNAVASLAADHNKKWDFVRELWTSPIPEGKWRYYNGLLYMLSLLNVSGNYKVYMSENATLELPPEPVEEAIPDGAWSEILNHTQTLSANTSNYKPYSSSSSISFNKFGPSSTQCLQITGGGASGASGIKLNVSDLLKDGDYAKAEFRIHVTGATESIQAFLTDGNNRLPMKYSGTETFKTGEWISYTTAPTKAKSDNGELYFCVTNASGFWYLVDLVLYKLDPEYITV
ncbi:MAG: glycosyl hydrolase family 8 [Ruminococcus sp.]|nr:glycosyl hydrolase family 8 [Ruminococcus sp.]